jgi:hypothetical protein
VPDSEIGPGEIRALAHAVIDARLALAEAIRKACPGPHSYVDHHDGNTWWCYFCGYTAAGSRVARPKPCPTCTGPIRETVGMVCQTCGADYNVTTSDDWTNDPVMRRAALTGWAQNPAVPTAERLAAALQVIEMQDGSADQATGAAAPSLGGVE